MKKTRLFGMFALTFALVFGAVSCAQPTGDAPADVKDDAASLVGKWKCVEYEVDSDENYDDAIKTLLGADATAAAEKLTDAAKEAYMRSQDFEIANEEEAKAYIELLDAQKKAFDEQKAKAKEKLEEQKKAMAAIFALGGATLDEYEVDGDLDITISKGRDQIVIETSESGSMKVTYNGESASASMSGSTRTVWEKQ